jgi:hypothetical protein
MANLLFKVSHCFVGKMRAVDLCGVVSEQPVCLVPGYRAVAPASASRRLIAFRKPWESHSLLSLHLT